MALLRDQSCQRWTIWLRLGFLLWAFGDILCCSAIGEDGSGGGSHTITKVDDTTSAGIRAVVSYDGINTSTSGTTTTTAITTGQRTRSSARAQPTRADRVRDARQSVSFDFGWKFRTGLTDWAPRNEPPPNATDPGRNPPESNPNYDTSHWSNVQLPHDGLIVSYHNRSGCCFVFRFFLSHPAHFDSRF